MHALLDQVWRACSSVAWTGDPSLSGLVLNAAYAHRDAARRFPVEVTDTPELQGCRCGEVLRGVIEPSACGLFRRVCTPRNPVGPCMVSAEGACAAFYKYGG